MADKFSKNKPIIFFAVWVLSGVVLTVFNKFETSGITTLENNLNLVITLVATAIYFIPMLFVIYRQAKAVSLKWLLVVTKILFFYLCSAFVVFLIVLLCV